MKNWELWLLDQFFHRRVNGKNLQKIILSSLICPLQMTNWQWTPIIDPSCRKRTLYPLPIKKIPIPRLIFLRTVDCKNYQKIFFSSLMCPLKMSNDIEPISLTLHGVNGHFIEWPPMLKMTKSAIIGTAGKIFKNKTKKNHPWGILFNTFVPIYGPKVLIAYVWEADTTLVFEKLALNSLRNGPGVTYSKFQNRSSRSSPGTPIYWYLMK